MARKHVKKKKNSPSSQAEQVQIPNLASPGVSEIINKMDFSDVKYTEDLFIKIMNESYDLADEPEFQDLLFDQDKILQVVKQWTTRYRKRVEKIEKTDKDKAEELQDEIRIMIIDDLATSSFRQNVIQRLMELIRRLRNSKDPAKFQTAIVLATILNNNKIPWGVCGLILKIFERSLVTAMEIFNLNDPVDAEIINLLESKGLDLDQIEDMNLKEFEHLAEKLDLDSDSIQKLEEKADQLIDKFEQKVFEGKNKLNLFTKVELKQYDNYLAEQINRDFNVMPENEEMIAKHFIDTSEQLLINLMTKERFDQFCADLR